MSGDSAQSDLERFLRARVHEDQRIIESTVDELAAGEEGDARVLELFVVRFSPGRMRAEARARAELVALHAAQSEGDEESCDCPRTAAGVCRSLAVSAWGYLGHPEYDLSWEHV